MDQPRSQSQPPQAQTRDMMYCHECRDEWYRDEHGLTCPECGSDFTEVIEDDNDPRDDITLGEPHAHDHAFGDHDDDDGMPALEEVPASLLNPNQRNPWRENDDPPEDDISNLQWTQVAPGRFAVRGTIHRTVSPADFARGGAGSGPGALGGFASLLNNIVGGALGGAGAPQQQQAQGQPQADQGQNPQAQNTSQTRSGTLPGGGRFTYTSGMRITPRDANNPGPYVQPVDELNNVLVGIMAAFGEQPGMDRGQGNPFNGMPAAAGEPGHALHPIMQLMSQVMIPGGVHGDAVYSQEALDRIITQLMEQNATSNAPGPASRIDIDSLPRKPITVDMLGDDGRADCSICMDEVNIGEEVAELPCHHWFHHQCIAAWLGEHDTCPHCRTGISKHDGQGPAQGGNNNANGNTSGGAASASTMPGAFGGADGDGTAEHPFVFPDSPPPQHAQPAANPGQEQQPGESSSAGGIGERIRRGLFGP